MRKPTIYIFMNKAFGMSAGKLAAQAAHAVARVPVGKEWDAPHRTILVMQARDEAHINNIMRYLDERSVKSYAIIDEGVNEIDPHVITALASQVVDKEDENINDTFSTFELYRDTVRISLEVDR